MPQAGEPAYPRRFDILVIDEAHNVAPSGLSHYATDSDRTKAVRTIAPHFEHKLFLSATPHNGYRESFSALLELLDNQRFARGVDPDRDQLNAVMVRRLKSEIENWDGSPLLFQSGSWRRWRSTTLTRKRQFTRRCSPTPDRAAKNATSRAETFATRICVEAAEEAPVLLRSCVCLDAGPTRALSPRVAEAQCGSKPKIQEAALLRDIDRAEEDYADDAEMESAADDALQTASLLFRPPTADEEKLLQQMRNWAATASARSDAKAAALVDWLKQHIRPNGVWSAERVIIFTEYRATQNWLQTILVAHGLAGGDRLLTLNGSTGSQKSAKAVKAAFQYDPALSPVRILLTTDAASEGIDLQNHCSRLIHNEIPWNPNRMEQRNGRIDRHGQRAKEVNIYHFVAKGYKKRLAKCLDPHRRSRSRSRVP